MKYAINDSLVLSREPEGPLAVYLSPFAEFLSQQGYAQHYIHQHVRLAACFGQWINQRKVSLPCITTKHAVRYLKSRYRRQRACSGDRASLGHFIEFLRCEGAIPADRQPTYQPTPVEQCAQAYEQYLREERCLAEVTIINYVPFIRQFLKECFGTQPVKLSSLSAKDVVEFVQRQARQLLYRSLSRKPHNVPFRNFPY